MQFLLLDGVDVAVDGLEVAVVVLLANLPHQFNYKFADNNKPSSELARHYFYYESWCYTK